MSDLEKIKAGERQTYYGDGRQPWDDILEQGWGAAFAAGNVLKYMRRSKEPEKDIAKAKWYYTALKGMTSLDNQEGSITWARLNRLLTQEEKDKLHG